MTDEEGAPTEAGELDAAALAGVAGGAGPAGRSAPKPAGGIAGSAVEAFAPDPQRPQGGTGQVADTLKGSLDSYGLPHQGAVAPSPAAADTGREQLLEGLKRTFGAPESTGGKAGRDTGATAEKLETLLGAAKSSGDALAKELDRTGTSKSEVEVQMFGSAGGTRTGADTGTGAPTRSGGGRPDGRG